MLALRVNLNRCVARCYGYKSVYHSDNLYPDSVDFYKNMSNSSEDTKNKAKKQIKRFSGEVPIKKLQLLYSKSSGPGGQHVNKTDTKVEIRFKVDTADWIPDTTKELLHEKFRRRISRTGELIVSSDKSRYQLNNVKTCLDEIKKMIHFAETPPKEKETFQPTIEQVQRSHEKRLRKKKMNSLNKQMRNTYE